MSEKFDGVRVFWDGVKLHTRQGKEIKVPEFISERLPTEFALDGELW
jgi:DNA ligase-1